MTLKQELFNLFENGKGIDECIKMDYKRATVYRIHKIYRSNKEKEQLKALIDESEQFKKVFSAFQEGWELRKIIIEYGISPQKVINLHENYIKIVEIEAGYKENLDRINEMMHKKDALLSEIGQFESKLKPLIDKFNELINRWCDFSLFRYLQDREQVLQTVIDFNVFPDSDYSKEKVELKYIQKIRTVLPCSARIEIQ